MEITVAKNAGFCFGVERAVKAVYDLIENKKPGHIFTLGNLIHNPTITNDLEKKGVVCIEPTQIDSIYEACNSSSPATVVIRAHGVTKELYSKLERYSKENEFFNYLDCTCPYVKKIHNIVKENTNENTTLLIFGDHEHPEVKGIKSFSPGETVVFSSIDELKNYDFAQKNVVVVSQTTQNLTEWKKSQKFIENYCTNRLIFDTICSVTEKRQSETEELSQKVDLMIIIGGRNSSNTNKLFSVSKKHLSNTFLIETPDEIPFALLNDKYNVGISAGASTPGGIIQEVKNKMSELNSNAVTENTQDSVFSAGEASFAELLEQSFKTLHTGEIVKCTVLAVNSNEIQVDVGAKVTGIIPMSEVSDNPSLKIEEEFKVGDEIEAMVTRVSDIEGVATLSKKRVDSINNWSAIVDSYKNGEILTGKVVDIIKGGVLVFVNSQRLFVPASQSGLAKDADLSILRGTEQKVKIIDIDESRKRAVASIRVVQREEKAARAEKIWAEIEEGKKYDGVVKSMTNYGVFVDLGGVDGMVHATELSWTHIKHPSEIVSIGQNITVFVKEFDKEKKRISLGYKTEENDPWRKFTADYAVGDEVEVKIVSMMPFGAFAEILPGVDGLIHISQIANKKISKPADVLENGQTVRVKITDIDDEKRKVSLSIRTLLSEEEPAEEAVEEATEASDEATEAPDEATEEKAE